MSTRTREAHWYRTHWTLPTDLDGFLKAIGADLDDRRDAEFRVRVTLLMPNSRVMPPELRTALRRAGLLPPAQS